MAKEKEEEQVEEAELVDDKSTIKDVEKKEEEQLKKHLPQALQAQADGYLIGTTLEEQYRIATFYKNSQMLPKAYNTEAKILTGLQYARELGFAKSPLMVLRNLSVINGHPALWGEMPLSLVKMHQNYEFHNEYFVDDKGDKIDFSKKFQTKDIWSAVFEIKFKNQEMRPYYWNRDDVTRAIKGIQAIWDKYPLVMWKRKCRGGGIKDYCPEVLLGISIGEYEQEWKPKEADFSGRAPTDKPDVDVSNLS